MNVTVLHLQIVILECPLAEVCRLRPPLDGLADRLRREMQHGREHNRRPDDLPGVTANMADAFCHCPVHN